MTTSYSHAAGVGKRTAERNQPFFFFCSSLPLTPHFKTFVKHIIRDDNKSKRLRNPSCVRPANGTLFRKPPDQLDESTFPRLARKQRRQVSKPLDLECFRSGPFRVASCSVDGRCGTSWVEGGWMSSEHRSRIRVSGLQPRRACRPGYIHSARPPVNTLSLRNPDRG